MRATWKYLVAILLIACTSRARAVELHPGIQYEVIPDVGQPAPGHPITVQEFFWYGCPHCFRLDPLISRWAKQLPNGVVFERVPDALGRLTGVVDQKAYYVAHFLGILPETHRALFNAIHVEHKPMGTLREIRRLYVDVSGIHAHQFDRAAASTWVRDAVRRADRLAALDGVLSVPTLVIGGYYKVDGAMAAAGHPGDGEISSYRRMLVIAKTLALRLQSPPNH